ncbi:vesicle-associated protein 2-2 isoform X1 [Ricinus communis]|uniref:vesicle-associated protein 2-2 isoform X1 n=1 Tax=Ricinus communis TaxID=3988 RepID=UPI00077250CE|nr:vesicle-associated protein 2-2 isoform X1 [Ricinus communis]XP_015573295.1 vesicle-associated protein 2-2 isoform X1 [Ricinus communis]XP_048234789.1 vesicle-associated protein 2-2 isoform X1 [Ricinus communis]|eukprot:XP_015573294.1 vesicle-associated protein 2-2 isoform X1 [Ricinus communis]
MAAELLEVQPREIEFTFELKKQSSCSIQLINRFVDQYVAFKVKTTSPKKYCVRPNIGVIKPKASCEFTVTMQAQKVAPPDFLCKDKFLVQSTIVPFGTTDEDITSGMFSKESGKYIEEKKLRVVLTNAPTSPVLLPNNGELKKDPFYDTSLHKDISQNGIENIPPPERQLDEDISSFQSAKVIEELKTVKDEESRPADDAEELESAKDVVEAKLVKDFEELKTRLHLMDSKLREADHKIMKLTDESSTAIREKNMLKQEVELLRRNKVKRIQMGFPLLYVCTVSLISLVIGYLIHP